MQARHTVGSQTLLYTSQLPLAVDKGHTHREGVAQHPCLRPYALLISWHAPASSMEERSPSSPLMAEPSPPAVVKMVLVLCWAPTCSRAAIQARRIWGQLAGAAKTLLAHRH